jgi:hypothetical protein
MASGAHEPQVESCVDTSDADCKLRWMCTIIRGHGLNTKPNLQPS